MRCSTSKLIQSLPQQSLPSSLCPSSLCLAVFAQQSLPNSLCLAVFAQQSGSMCPQSSIFFLPSQVPQSTHSYLNTQLHLKLYFTSTDYLDKFPLSSPPSTVLNYPPPHYTPLSLLGNSRNLDFRDRDLGSRIQVRFIQVRIIGDNLQVIKVQCKIKHPE